MSGQPVNTDSDAIKFRNEYMDNLNLETQIQDMNFQANKIYIQSGQLPPQAQMPDTRSTAEKLKDIELLKKTIIEDLRPIAEPAFALEIYNRVEQHALNVEGGFLRWLAQNGEEIAKQLSKKYKFGIAGDINDAEIIVQYIASAYSTIRHSAQSIKSFMSSSSGIGKQSSNAVLSVNDIDPLIITLQDFKKRLIIFGKKNPQVSEQMSVLVDSLTKLKRSLPTTEELRQLMEHIDDPIFMITRESRNLTLVFDILKALPPLQTINTLLYNAERAIDNQDMQSFNLNINQIINLFGFVFEPQNIDALYIFMREFKEPAERQLRYERTIESKQLRNEIRQQTEQERDLSKADKVYVVNPITDPVNTFDSGNPRMELRARQPRREFITPDTRNLRSMNIMEILHQMQGMTDQAIQQNFDVVRETFQRIDANPAYNSDIENTVGFNALQQNPEMVRQIAQLIIQRLIPPGLPNSVSSASDFGITGRGIKQRKGRPRGGSIVPVPKKPAFVGFGINEIDQLKLDKNILSIRRNTRSKIKGMGNKHISEPMKRIIKNFIGGSVPSYNDLSSLDNEEKEYLNKIVEHSDLKDRLSVPAPSKDQREKDFHSFEVMKGEILAGNDSKELIKKFKLLMIKLSRQNLLPKSEVQELMEELVELGY